jgi:tetratricopeptide (TPR) repeat protein
MRSWQRVARLLVVCLGAGCLLLPVSPLLAAERCKDFVDGLRAADRGYYDVALEYLEAMRTSPLADKAFRETIDYEIGVTLLEESRTLPLAERDSELEKARVSFQKFLNEYPQNPLVVLANRCLATVLVERGMLDKELARRSGKTAEERDQLLEQARGLFQDAQKALAVVDAQLSKTQRAFGKVDPSDTAANQRRNRVRSEIILTRLELAKTLREIAFTYEAGSNRRKVALQEAAAKFGEYYWKYEQWLGGCVFRLEEARCYKELGDYAKATTILEELATLRTGEEEGFRHIRTAATKLAMQTLLAAEVKKYKNAWAWYEKWENSSDPVGGSDSEAAAVQYLGGQAALELARSIDTNDAAQSRLRGEYLKRAKDLLSLAASTPNEYRKQARLLFADPLLTAGQVRVETPKGFADACDRAKLAWEKLQEGGLTAGQIERFQAEARECFRFALAHAPDSAKIDDLNTIRYCLAYLYWVAEDYYDAAVLGEFLARRHPECAQAQRGAEIAMKAYARLCGESVRDDDRQFEAAQMTAMADFITKRWPKSSVADEAWMAQIQIAMSKHDSAKALGCLERIAADSPRRGDAELMAGQALWRAYLEAVRLPEAQQPTKAEMSKTISTARKLLEDAVARLRKPVDAGGEVSLSAAVGSLALAQVCLQMGEGTKAVEWIDDAKIGAHTLAKAGNKAVDRGNFRAEAFKAALRAYVATQQLDKAKRTMNALEKAGNPADVARLYMSLGRQLEDSFKRLHAEGNEKEAANAARGFEFFLARIAARPAAESTFATLYWVADTFVTLGNSLSQGDGRPPADAMRFYKKAAEVYEKMIEACGADPKFAPQPGAITACRIRLARCLRREGEFKQSLQVLVEVLKASETLLEAQREAAYTYQAWGEEVPGYYVLAIRGGKPVKRKDGSVDHLVWGWNGIARRVQFVEKYNDTFNEARFNFALCRMKYAESKKGQERVDQLRQAEDDILVVLRIQPKMGGEKWYGQYDALLRDIQRRLGVKEDKQGLKAAEKEMSPGAK